MTLGGGTQLADNKAGDDGGAVLGWDANGTVVFNDVLCTENSAVNDGGCFYAVGKATVNDGTVMLQNSASQGGSILAAEGCDISVRGGTFTTRSSTRGGFIYVEDNAHVVITGGWIENNVATKSGGAVYVKGNGPSDVSIEGGTFRNNKALEMGGAIALWGESTLVKVTGGTFENNEAKYYGGFVSAEEGGSITCKGATVTGNYAGDQGGGIYARQGTLVTSSCDLVANEAPQGAAIYLTYVKNATFEDHIVSDNLASTSSVVYFSASSVVAKRVTFESSVGLQEYSFNRAVQLDDNSTLAAEKCVFDGWLGDTVVFNDNSASGSLVLNSCDFSGSSALFAVISPNSDAEIRNAVVSSFTFENAIVDNSLALVDRALSCNSANACGSGECVDSLLGVLCECIEGGDCLHDGGDLLLSLETPPAVETVYPDTVSYELMISAASGGTTYAIWKLAFEDSELDLDVVPSSGVLAAGSTVVVTVTGTPSTLDVGGLVTNIFKVIPPSDSTTAGRLTVSATFYLCPAYEYAMPLETDGNDFLCEKCETIEGNQGLECMNPGATLASMPIRKGYWRSSSRSTVVRKCLHSGTCKGGTHISNSDDYCEDGYKGPYCAVCDKGYGRSLDTCHSCNGTTARLLITLCLLSSVATLLLLFLVVVFLTGGLDAVDIVRRSATRKLSRLRKASSCWCPAPRATLFPKQYVHDDAPSADCWDDIIGPGVDSASHVNRGGDGVGAGFWEGAKSQRRENGDPELVYARPLGDAVGVGADVRLLTVRDRHAPDNEATSSGRDTQRRILACTGVSDVAMDRRSDVESSSGAKSMCCMIGKKINRWAQRLPWEKIKILVVIWQILAVFSGITGVEFPATYALFLSWINVWNFDIGYILSASCVLPSVNFYERLLATTLAPFVVIGGLVWTYRIANRRAGIGSAGVNARAAAWSRHVSAGLLINFLVFTSASSVVFNAFPCDDSAVDGESYLIADYSISCQTRLHLFFRTYAAVMILVYPIGIPTLYSVVLWKHRELLNPRIHAVAKPETSDANKNATAAHSEGQDGALYEIKRTAPKGQPENEWCPQQLQELEERVKARAEHPDLVPFKSLWGDFGPNMYYFEVIECGRRIFLLDVIILIMPHTVTQAAVGCIFALVNLVVFELIRPHVDPADAWLYRLGCVLIFLSGFLAMMIKMDVAEEANRSVFGVCLVALNVALVLAVSWFVMRHIKDSSDEDETTDA